jgi:hypothetical protein
MSACVGAAVAGAGVGAGVAAREAAPGTTRKAASKSNGSDRHMRGRVHHS